MRASPWIIFGLLLCTSSAIADDWTTVARATTQSNTTQSNTAQHQPAAVYDPAQSIEQYNRLAKTRDPSAYMFIAAEVPREQVSLRKIVDRPARFSTDEHAFSGRVSAAFLRHSESQTVTLHILIENRREAGKWLLQPATSGILSLKE